MVADPTDGRRHERRQVKLWYEGFLDSGGHDG
jgi:hypothetical protein